MTNNLFVSDHPLVKHKITQLRDTTTDFRQFRSIVAELAMILAYEATADLVTKPVEVQTPLTTTSGNKSTNASAWSRSCAPAWAW
jgi:uracil phosphoribosyltransferase